MRGALYPKMGVEWHPPPTKGGRGPPPPLYNFLVGVECHPLPIKYFPDNQILDFATQAANLGGGRGAF